MQVNSPITKEQLGAEIVRQASLFMFLVETRPNADWDDPRTPYHEAELATALRGAMRELGWESGDAYCIAFAGAMALLAIRKLMINAPAAAACVRVKTLVSPSVMQTVGRARTRGYLSQEGSTGAIWLAQHGSGMLGHAGIVKTFHVPGINMATIEGNTSVDAVHDQREGEGIFAKVRTKMTNGNLHTQGFINPEVWLA